MVLKEHIPAVTTLEFEAYLQRPENADRLFELIDGEIVEKMPTEEHGEVSGAIFAYIFNFNRVHRLGRVTLEARHTMPNSDDHDVMPDVSFIVGIERPSVSQGAIPQMPDLAVEVKSPDDKLPKLLKKVAYYLENGTRWVWVVFPESRTVHVYQATGEVQVFGETDVLTAEDILPGFRLPVRDIFPPSAD